MKRDWPLIGDPKDGDCTPEQWIEDSILIGHGLLAMVAFYQTEEK